MIDYSVMLLNRRLRERFRMETILRHEDRICRAIYVRVSKNRA